MIKWGRWAAQSSGRGVNGLAAYPAYNLVHIRSNASGVDLVDAEVLQIDKVMHELRKKKSELWDVGYCVYVLDMGYSEVAGKLGCHRNTITSRLNMVHIAVEKQISICQSA